MQKHRVRALTGYIMTARYNRTTGKPDNRLSLDEAGKVINGIISNGNPCVERLEVMTL